MIFTEFHRVSPRVTTIPIKVEIYQISIANMAIRWVESLLIFIGFYFPLDNKKNTKRYEL